MDKSKLLTNFKTLLESIVILITLIIVLLFLLSPITFNKVLTDAGFEEGSVVGFKWKNKLIESDQLLKDLKQQNKDLIEQNQSLLSFISKKEPLLSTEATNNLNTLTQNNNKLIDRNIKLGAKADVIISDNSSLLVNSKTKNIGIVFSADTELSLALYEVTTIAKKFNIPNAKIFYRNNSYRSVSLVNNLEEANDVLYKARQKRPDSYIVDLNTWCKNSIEQYNYIKCF